jgi:hypothetical protein
LLLQAQQWWRCHAGGLTVVAFGVRCQCRRWLAAASMPRCRAAAVVAPSRVPASRLLAPRALLPSPCCCRPCWMRQL